MKIGSRIKALRERRGWTQLELAHKAGINNSVLSRIESGKRPVEDMLIAKFADLFDVDADYLLGRTRTGDEAPAFYPLPSTYTDEEFMVAEAAVEAYRKLKNRMKKDK